MATEESSGIKSVRRAFDVVDTFRERGPSTVSDIALALDIPVSTVHNHLSTLTDQGYVRNADGTYELGFRFLELGGHVRNESPIYQHGRPPINELANETGELANLMVEEDGKGVHIYLARGAEAFAFDTHAGMRFHLHNNALGKAILSGCSSEQVDEIVAQHRLPATTENTISDRETLAD